MIELRDLQCLLSLNEHRHFGRAAEALEMSQPALTKSLQRLERRLGVQLFDRSRARVAPTAVGIEVIEGAKRVAGDVEDLLRSVDQLGDLQRGSLTVGVGPAMAESHLSRAFAQIVQQHPLTRTQVRVDHWEQLSEWLLSNDLDFFIADMGKLADDGRFECTPLPAEEFVWFCRAGHPLASQTRVTRQDLLRFPVATPRMPPWATDWFAAGRDDPSPQAASTGPALECENYAMLKRIVAAGDCVSAALLPTIQQEIDDRRFAVLPVDAPQTSTHAGIVRLRDRTLSPLAAKAVELIVSIAAQQ